MKTNINPNSNQNLSKKMEDYYAKKSSPEESHELEKLALEDDFTADAMEGLEAFPEAMSSVPEFPKEKNYTGLYVVGFTLLASALIWFMVINPFAESEKQLTQNNVKEIVKLNSEVKNKEVTKLKNKKITTLNKEIVNKKNTLVPNELKEKTKFPKRERFDFPKEELNPLKFETKKEYDLARAKTKIIGFHNFLAVDYSVIYTNSQKFEIELNGIRANRENKTSKSKFEENNASEKTFSYKEYLKESLGYLEDKNYTLATENFQTILKHYPEDVNAQFYLGYIYFYTNSMEKCIHQMDKTHKNSFYFFREDAEWYKANALQKLGKIKQAAILFKKIKADGGYYSYKVKS